MKQELACMNIKWIEDTERNSSPGFENNELVNSFS